MERRQEEPVIQVKELTKIYRLYDKPTDRLKESLGFSRKKRYKEHYALDRIGLEVYKGETVGIIGTNGSGKSTILKIITGVLNPTSGEVNIRGRISALLELGAGFNGEFSGLENVYLNGTMIGFTREEIDAKLQDILDFADIGEFINQPVKTYSSGMFVRLAFAVAINIEPEILIVDEALSVGDVFFQAKCFKKFEEFKNQGKTILFVSHDLSAIAKYCDRAVLLNSGHKLLEGPPSQVIDVYKQVLVGQFDANTKKNLTGENETAEEEKTATPEQQVTVENGLWMSHYGINPDRQDYGDKRCEIVDFAIRDHQGIYTNTLMKGEHCTIRIKIRAHEGITDPIVAFTIRTIKGTDVTGTNTMFEKVNLGRIKAEEERTITFSQDMDLQGGQYLLCLGCTRFEENDFRVYHRIYDVCNIEVISHKNTVGYYDMNSKVEVE